MPSGRPIREILARNTAFNAVGRLWEAASTLVLTAYVLEGRVDMAAWGLWAFVNVFTGYMGLLDLGVGSSFAKYIAEHKARNEDEQLSAVVSTGFFFYAVFGLVLVAVGWPCIDHLMDLFARLGPGRAGDFGDLRYTGDARFLFQWGLVIFAVSNCVAAFTAVQTGLQRMGVTNVLSFLASLVKIGAVVYFLETGHGVRGLLYANALVLALFGAASVVVAFRIHPALRVSPTRIRRAAFSKLFSFGWRAQIAKLSNLIMFQTDKLIVAVVFRYLGMVGLYELGLSLANKMRQAPLLLVSALVPAASHLDARADHDRLRLLYLRSTKYVAAVTLPLVAFTAGAAGPLMRTWMGEKGNLEVAIWVLRIIAVGYVANILPGPGVGIVLGKGRADLQMKAGAIATLSNLALTVLLVWRFGFYGIPVATALSMFLSCTWFFLAIRPLFDIGLGRLLRTTALWPAVASIPGLAVCVLGDLLTGGATSRDVNAVAVLVCGGVFGLTYGVLIRMLPFLDHFDVDFLGTTLKLRRVPGFDLLTRRAGRV